MKIKCHDFGIVNGKDDPKMVNFIVECHICGQQYENWIGSTPCCGAVAYELDENGKPKEYVHVFGIIFHNQPH